MEDEEVGDWASFESESWEVWKGQEKVGLYSLSRMPEHLRWIQCLDIALHCMDVWRLLIIDLHIRQM